MEFDPSLTAEELIARGDALLAAGRSVEARRAYAEASARAPNSASVQARRGFARYEPPIHANLLPIQRAIEASFPDSDAFVSSHIAVWGKNNSFMRDGRLRALVWKYQSLLPLPNWEWNFQAALWAVAQTRDLPGDYVELGVFKGHTTLVLAEYYDFAGWDRRWWLYDTFDGVPDDQLNEGWAERNQTAYRSGKYSFEEVAERFRPFPNIDVIKGRVPEILRERCPERIAFLHMDLNSAAAEIAALDFVFDRIVPGGVILFDDYAWLASQEQYLAEKAWMRERGLAVLEMPTGQGLFVKR
jgi:hypothetical protein